MSDRDQAGGVWARCKSCDRVWPIIEAEEGPVEMEEFARRAFGATCPACGATGRGGGLWMVSGEDAGEAQGGGKA